MSTLSYCVDNSLIEIFVIQSSEGDSVVVSIITSELVQADLSSMFDRLWRKVNQEHLHGIHDGVFHWLKPTVNCWFEKYYAVIR